MADVALSAAQWVVAKALAPVMDSLLGAWAASRNFGPNIEALRDKLLLVKATLEIAGRKEIGGPAMEELLQRLRDSAHNAEDLLDELDYFRIHDELHNTHEAADEHGESGVQDLARDARHTTKAIIGKQLASLTAHCFGANAGHPRQEDARQHVSCCAWKHGRRRSPGDSSSAPNPDQEVSGCMPKLGKLFPVSSSMHPHVSGDEDCGNAQETPKLDFNRVDFSQRMKDIVEKLQPLCKDVNKILQGCGPRIAPDIAQHRPTTTPQSSEPKLYGRDRVMNSIIHDITEGQYCDKGLTVLPVVGPGGMGKTTMIQHIYHNQKVRNHFPVRIWICVSFNFNLDKVLEAIKRYTPAIEGETEIIRTEELIEQRLKSKRFLLILDDIWQFTDADDWNKLLLILGQSEEKGCMILVTTRFQAIAQRVKTTGHPKELNGLEPEEFRKLFLVFVFDDGQCPVNKLHLLDKIMEKLKGSPLAAKTVGRLLRTDPSMGHWRRVLNSEEWETGNNGIMSALKLSYDFLPFNLQQCFFYSALFPEDYRFRSHELISLWVGLDILTPCGQNPTFEGGLRILNDLVNHGFFREEEIDGGLRYVMHDLLHELALKVASNDCLSLRLPNVGSVKIQPTTRHLSISTDDFGKYDVVSGEKLKSELEQLKTRFKVEDLQTLMLFGKMDEGFVKIFGDFLGEANTLRVLHLPKMLCPMELMLHNFSGLVHLRYLCLGTQESQMHLPLSISKFYHLRILHLEWWNGSRDLPEDMSNLAKLCHFYVPSDDQLHSDICNVGKLKLLEELKVFQVNKKGEGFEPKQLGHLTKLRELGIYSIEKIRTEEEAAQAKLIEKSYLRKLTLDWDSERSSVQPSVEAVVLESLQPHRDLQVLCIRGHEGPSCPTWLGDEFAVEALQSLYLYGVSWEIFPSLGKAWDLRKLKLEHIAKMKEFIIEESFCRLIRLELIGLRSFEKWVCPAEQESFIGGDLSPQDVHMFPLLQVLVIRNCPNLLGLPFSKHIVFQDWFPKVQELKVLYCPEFSSVILISWIESLHRVEMRNVKLLEYFWYSKSSNGAQLEISVEADLQSIDQVLVFDKETGLEKLTLKKCPPLELKHLLMLTSLRTLIVENSVGLVGRLGGGRSDVKWQLPVEYIRIWKLKGNSGKELTKLLPHLPKLSKLEIWRCKNIKKLAVGVGVQQTTQEASEMEGGEITAAAAEELPELLPFWWFFMFCFLTDLFPKLSELVIWMCRNIRKLVVGMDVQQTTSEASEMGEDEITALEASEIGGGGKIAATEEEDDGVLLFPAHLCDSLRELDFINCPELVLGGGLQALRSLQRLTIQCSPKFLSTFSFSHQIFPSSLQFLKLENVEGMGTLEPLSNLSSLTKLELLSCGEDLKCQGLCSLLTTGGQLNELEVKGSPRFFADWDPNPRRALKDAEGGEEQQTQLVSSTLHELWIDDIAGLLSASAWRFLSSSLTKLELGGRWSKGMKRFSKEQEDALQLLSSLQELEFWSFNDLQQLPAGLRNLTSLKRLSVNCCPAISSLPNDALPDSLEKLDVFECSEELKQYCRGLKGTIPRVKIL